MSQSRNNLQKQIKIILEKEGLSIADNKISQIEKGNVNKLFVIKKGVILRFSDDSTSSKRLVKEAELLKFIIGTIPVPEVYSYGSINNIGYQMLSVISGNRLSDVWPKLSISNKNRIVTQFSEILFNLHSIRKSSYKTVCIPSTVHRTWVDYNDNEFDRVIKYLTAVNLPKEIIIKSQKYYDINKKYFTESSPACLIHGDLYFDNILISRNKISAIIDFEFAAHAPIESELYKIEEFSRSPSSYGYNANYNYVDFIRLLKEAYPVIFKTNNLESKLHLYDFLYTWKAFKYNDEFNLVERKKNLDTTLTKINEITNNKIARII